MIELDKAKLREFFKKERSALSAPEVAEKSEAICQNFITNLLPKIYQENSNQIFSLYLAAMKEVSCETIARFFRDSSILFSYPKIIQKDAPLKFVETSDSQKFSANKFYPKILEPLDGKVVSPDFLILPLLAFDDNLSRLGMGGGFFDRTILQLTVHNPKIITIGLGYEFQRVGEDLPIEKTDQRLDFIVTEKNIFSRS